MVEDPLLYCLTLFTFLVIFGLCYIRRVFTYFERHQIPLISTPGFPFGNIGDIVSHQNVLFIKLWKYHKYCKRQNYKFAGFYLFLKPAIIVSDRQYFISETTLLDNCSIIDELSSDLVEFFDRPWYEIFKDPPTDGDQDCTKFVNEYVVLVTLKIFDLEKSVFDRAVVKCLWKTQRFWNLFQIAYPYFVTFSPLKSTHLQFRQIVQNLMDHRKKNDVHKDDLIQILIDSGYNSDKITDLALETVKKVEIAADLILLCLLELALNHEIQDDLRGEVCRFNKKKSLKDLHELSYLDTIVSETFRKYPPVPLIWSENSRHPDLPSGTVFLSIFGIHHDPENYPNPELFDPDRFSEENLHFVEPNNYLPFGGGRKNDDRLIRLIIKMALIEWIPKFQFSIGRKTKRPLNFDESIDNGIKSKDNIWLNLKRL